MSLIKTISHGNILNFFNTRDGAGSVLESESGAVWTATAALGTVVDNALIVNAEGSEKALTSGSIESPAAGSDWALMALFNADASIIKQFGIGTVSGDEKITIAPGSAVTLKTTAATLTLNTDMAPAEILYKHLITFDLDGDVNYHYAEPGTDLSATPNDTGSASVTSDITALGDALDFSAFGGNADIIFYGCQMVEFPNGLPSDVITKADECMEAWHVGNKRHYELLEEND